MAAHAGPAATHGVSGFYPPLLIGIDPGTGLLTGFFESHTGWDETLKAPRFHCVFYVHGRYADGAYQVQTWYPGTPGVIPGTITFSYANRQWRLHMTLTDTHGGCWNVYPFDTQQGNTFTRETPGAWLAIRLVSAPRAYFHRQPEARTKRQAYVVRYDVVRLFDSKDGWVEAAYGTDKTTRGWLREQDLFGSTPPRSP
jgi:hypothetical protein